MSEAPTPGMRQAIRQLTDTLYRRMHGSIPNAPHHEIVWGVIASVSAGPPKSVGVKIQGHPNVQLGIKYLSSYTPVVGDVVVLTHYGRDLWVIGSTAAAAPAGFGAIRWAWSGVALVPSGALGYLTEGYIYIPTGKSMTIVGVAYYSRVAGVSFQIERNGSVIAGSWTTTTSWQTDFTAGSGFPITLANGDHMAPVVTAVTSAPPDGFGINLLYTTG